jgi:spermidine synthase
MARFREAFSGSVWLDNLKPLIDIGGDLQRIRYFESKEFGKVLIINDELQHVEAWAPFYHEIIVHLPCSFIPKPSSALVLGGGSLFAAAELLKYDSIRSIDLVDYDVKMVESTARVYPATKSVLRDERLNIITQECKQYLTKCTKKYDLIINDCFDLHAEDDSLGYDLYQVIYDKMSEVGICSDLIYRSIYQDGHTQNALRRIHSYKHRAATLLAVPEYPGFLHLLTMWGKNVNVHQKQRMLFNETQMSMHSREMFQIYLPNNLNFYLYIPPYLASVVPK